jgi:uncharacterized membrane protein YfcA
MGETTLLQYALVAAAGFAASVLGGVTGYGGGLLLPPILVPIVDAEAVVPIIGVSALFSNASRLAAFRAAFDPRRAALIAACALPPCLLGAWGYTRLSGPGVAVLIGAMLVLLVPARRLLGRRAGLLSPPGIALAGAGYGLLMGGTTGSGVVLLSILLAAGLEGAAVIATDAGISLLLGLAKTAVFQTAGALPASSWVMALLIGAVSTPGAFVARRLTRGLTVRVHTGILDAVVILGGLVLVLQGLRG